MNTQKYLGQDELLLYLKQRRTRSYYGFLSHHRNIIVSSLTSLDTKWDVLNNSWMSNFLKEAKRILDKNDYITLKNKVELESKRSGIKDFWNSIIESNKENYNKTCENIKPGGYRMELRKRKQLSYAEDSSSEEETDSSEKVTTPLPNKDNAQSLYSETKEKFNDQEWYMLESSWTKVEEKITQQLPSTVNDNVMMLLDKYNQTITDATTWFHVEIGQVAIVVSESPLQGCIKVSPPYLFTRDWPLQWVQQIYIAFMICYQTPINLFHDASASEYAYRDRIINPLWEDLFLDVNHIVLMRTGEVENVDSKIQKNLSKHPSERRAIGWQHDAILIIKVNNIDVQVGFGEVVGNACIKDDKKACEDKTKLLKAMELALRQLRRLLLKKGIKEDLLWELETYGILVYRRDLWFYSMHKVDEYFLVNQFDCFALPDNCNHLKDVSNIIQAMLSFKSRVLHLHQRIESLLDQIPQRIRCKIHVTEASTKTSPKKGKITDRPTYNGRGQKLELINIFCQCDLGYEERPGLDNYGSDNIDNDENHEELNITT